MTTIKLGSLFDGSGGFPLADAPEYKMWGNGVSLPCVLYVMEGIAIELGRIIVIGEVKRV